MAGNKQRPPKRALPMSLRMGICNRQLHSSTVASGFLRPSWCPYEPLSGHDACIPSAEKGRWL